MGNGRWVTSKFNETINTYGFSSTRDISTSNVGQSFKAKEIDPLLNPFNITRECCDTKEHPNTVPVMLCLDCTGSMSRSLVNCFANLDKTITKLLKEVTDVEICVAGIGDFAYDEAPFQVSQYESDNRITDWLLRIFQEKGGGSNAWESYTAPWYFGVNHTKLDCWKRGKKGILITLGDETLGNYLPKRDINRVFGDNVQADVDTKKLYEEASEKFDIYHIAITDDECMYDYYKDAIEETFRPLLGQRLLKGKSSELPELITRIVLDSTGAKGIGTTGAIVNENGGIMW